MMMTVITTNTIFIISVILMDDGGTKALQLHREAKAEAETHFERDETNTHFQDTIPTHTLDTTFSHTILHTLRRHHTIILIIL